MDRDTFLDLLQQSRLLSEQQVAGIARRFLGGPHDGGDAAAMQVLAALTSEGVLTPYQAQRLANKQVKGLVLGQYRILEELGRGGFGQVYKALHTVMGRVVAVKVITPRLVEEARVRSWFRREVQAAMQLFHPNIVMAFDANEVDDFLFLVMEYLDGCDLDALVRKQGPLPVKLACEMMRQVGQGLQYAHERGMVHRDIKPANLLIPRSSGAFRSDGPGPHAPVSGPVLVKVTDFGLARLHTSVSASGGLSQGEAQFVGTPDYVSPEQARNASAVDIRSDLYSLGCTFYYVLTGRKPFRGESVFETLVKHMEEAPEPIEAFRPEIPPALASVVRRLMAKDPAKRFQTPAELVAELTFLSGSGETQASPALRAGKTPAVSQEAAFAADNVNTPTRCIPKLAFGKGLGVPGPRSATATEDAPPPNGPGGPGGDEDEDQLVPSSSITATEDLQGRDTADEEDLPAPPTDAVAAPFRLDPGLRSRLQYWLELVDAFVNGAEDYQVNEPAYRALHSALLDTCRSQAAAAQGRQRELLESLTSLVEPWVAPQALAAADRDSLASLLLRCQQVEQELFGRKRDLNFLMWIAVLLCAVFAAGAGWYATRLPGEVGLPRFSLTALWRSIEADPVVAGVVLLPLVILLSIVLVARMLRT